MSGRVRRFGRWVILPADEWERIEGLAAEATTYREHAPSFWLDVIAARSRTPRTTPASEANPAVPTEGE